MLNAESRIAVCSRSFSKNETLRKELHSRFPNVKFNDDGLSLAGSSLVNFLSGCEGAIIALEEVSNSVLSELPDLRVIGKYGVGLNNIDLAACGRHGVEIGWRGGVNALAVAELTLSMMLSLVRLVPESQDLVKKGSWRQVIGRQLSGRVVGIVGLGNVGKKLVSLIRPFNVKLLAHDIALDLEFADDYGVEAAGLDDLLERSDIVSLHVPLDVRTANIIGPRELEKLKSDAIIINTARGGILDEGAVWAALDQGRLGGVGLDVLAEEPPLTTNRFNDPRVIVTSHIGGSSTEAILAMGRSAIEGLESHQPARNLAS